MSKPKPRFLPPAHYVPAAVVSQASGEHYCRLLEFATMATFYVTRSDVWPGYMAEMKRIAPDMSDEAASEPARLFALMMAAHIAEMGQVALSKFAGGNGDV